MLERRPETSANVKTEPKTYIVCNDIVGIEVSLKAGVAKNLAKNEKKKTIKRFIQRTSIFYSFQLNRSCFCLNK
jgi:hypothetical protein